MAHASYLAAAAKPIDVEDAVRRFRENATQLRRLHSRPRGGRNAGATQSAIDRRLRLNEVITGSLTIGGYRVLAGELTNEANLLTRLATARVEGQDRPELKARLSAARRTIKDLSR